MRSVTLTPPSKPDGHPPPLRQASNRADTSVPFAKRKGHDVGAVREPPARRGCPFKIRASDPPIRQTSFRHAERKRLPRQLEEQSSDDGRRIL